MSIFLEMAKVQYLKFKFHCRYMKDTALKNHSNQVQHELNVRGYSILDEFLSRDSALKLGKEFEMHLKNRNNISDIKSDSRDFYIDQAVTGAQDFKRDNTLIEIGSNHLKKDLRAFFTMGNAVYSGAHASSGGNWHRDSVAPQFKVMVYLTDVEENNGAFQIYPGTQNAPELVKILRLLSVAPNIHRFAADTHEVLAANGVYPKTLTGLAGTAILFNSSTLHRGSPIKEGKRMAMTNYYFPASANINKLKQHFPK